MIEYNLSEQTEIPPGGAFSVRVIGVGGAGANVLDRMALEGCEEAELLTLNTDVRALSASVSNNKIQLGKTLLKGMGAGGDPDLGKQAALEAVDDIRGSLRGHQMAFVCVGLGGGTGSGAAPEICRIAKEEGVFLVVFATMPFTFEGKRRMDQALESLERIGRYANAVVTFDNDRMGELIVPKEGVQSAFAAADKIISQSIRATMKIVSHPGIIRIGMDELLSALRNDNSRCLFGFGVAKGDNRAHEALDQALKSPLLDRGKMLEHGRNVLVHVGGGDSMTLYEVELVMQELSKHIDGAKTQILFGTGTDKKLAGNLTVTIISSLQGPGGPRREAIPESSYRSPEPDNPAPRLGSPLMAPASPPPAVTPEPKNNLVQPVASVNQAEAEKNKKDDTRSVDQRSPMQTQAPVNPAPEPQQQNAPQTRQEPVVPAPAPASRATGPVRTATGPQRTQTQPQALPATTPAPAPAAKEKTAPVSQPQPQPEPREPVELQPVRKTAVIQPQPMRKPPAVEVNPVAAATQKPQPQPVPAAKPLQPPVAAAKEEWEDDANIPDTIGKMLAAGAKVDPDQTVPVTPPRASTILPPRESEGEVVVAQTGDSQKITLSRLAPGLTPSADDVSIGGGLSPHFAAAPDPTIGPELDAAAAQHQQMLQLEPLAKGRFAKTEPTIVDGEDMDVPTFLRKRRK